MTEDTNHEMDYAMRAVMDAGMRDSEEFRLWLQDAANRETFIELMAAREALMREKMARRQRFKSRIYFLGTAAAAAALLVVVLHPFLWGGARSEKSVRLFAAVDGATQVVLHADGCDDRTLADDMLDMSAEHPSENVAAESGYRTLATPRGKDFLLVLSDGTKVWLNAETQLRYPASFGAGERRVELTGEACFDVVKDENHPFVVSAGGMDIRVLGTRFNVRSYAETDRHVTLVNGKVELNDAARGSVMLQPGEDLTYAVNGEIEISQVNTEAYTAWTEGMFYFEDAPIEEIMSALGRWYNVNVDMKCRPGISDIRLNFWADRDAGITEVLTLLNKLKKVRAEYRDGTVTVGSI